MKSMFGVEYFALSGLWVSWRCHFIGLHPMLEYYALSGQTLGQFHYSPEKAKYTSDGHRPSLNNSEAVSPLANKKREL